MRKRILHHTLVLAMAMAFLLSLTSVAYAANVQVAIRYGQTDARTILKMINDFRTDPDTAWYWNEDNKTKAKCTGLKPLKYDYDLERIAMQRAAEIALRFDHTRPNGKVCFDAADQFGYRYYAMGENIAAGYGSASGVHKGWREDDESYDGQGHRRNMLHSGFDSVGIGHVYFNGTHYWVEEFAKAMGTSSPESEAIDVDRHVVLDVADSNITECKVSFSNAKYSLNKNESKKVSVKTVIMTEGRWGGPFEIENDPELSVEDNSIATVDGDVLTGVNTGTTTVLAEVFGRKATAKVVVNGDSTATDKPDAGDKPDSGNKPGESDKPGSGDVPGAGDKLNQMLEVSGASKTVKFSQLKKKPVYTSAVKVIGAEGTKTFIKTGGSKKLSINKRTGKILVKKGTKRGTYTISIKVKATETEEYMAGVSVVKKIKVRVR